MSCSNSKLVAVVNLWPLQTSSITLLCITWLLLNLKRLLLNCKLWFNCTGDNIRIHAFHCITEHTANAAVDGLLVGAEASALVHNKSYVTYIHYINTVHAYITCITYFTYITYITLHTLQKLRALHTLHTANAAVDGLLVGTEVNSPSSREFDIERLCIYIYIYFFFFLYTAVVL